MYEWTWCVPYRGTLSTWILAQAYYVIITLPARRLPLSDKHVQLLCNKSRLATVGYSRELYTYRGTAGRFIIVFVCMNHFTMLLSRAIIIIWTIRACYWNIINFCDQSHHLSIVSSSQLIIITVISYIMDTSEKLSKPCIRCSECVKTYADRRGLKKHLIHVHHMSFLCNTNSTRLLSEPELQEALEKQFC